MCAFRSNTELVPVFQSTGTLAPFGIPAESGRNVPPGTFAAGTTVNDGESPSGKHRTRLRNWPQLKNAAKPLSHHLYQHSWPPLELLGCHPHGSSVQKSTPA